jgi:hypothetical protein
MFGCLAMRPSERGDYGVQMRHAVALLLALLVSAITGCAKVPDSQGMPGQPSESGAVGARLRHWPEGRSVPFRITDSLTISIPLDYMRSAAYLGRERFDPPPDAKPVENALVQFDFFLPDFSGYTYEKYENEFDHNRVEVVHVRSGNPAESAIDAPGWHPPNQLSRILKYVADANEYRDQYGLRCYRPRVGKDVMYCYGRRDEHLKEDFLLELHVPPYRPGMLNPQMRTTYFSSRYGGVEISWRTSVDNLPRWREIDTKIWKYMDSWNIDHRKRAN